MKIVDEMIFGLERSIAEIEDMTVDQLIYYYDRAVQYHKRIKQARESQL